MSDTKKTLIMGRTRGDSLATKSVKTTFRMTETESEAIKWYSNQFGLSVSAFLRLQLKPALESAIEPSLSSDAYIKNNQMG